jgi:hypothetical protein
VSKPDKNLWKIKGKEKQKMSENREKQKYLYWRSTRAIYAYNGRKTLPNPGHLGGRR